MILYNLQYFGGRGSNLPSATPGGGGGGGNATFTNAPGGRVYGTAAEALGTKGRPMSGDRAALGANPNYNGDYKEYSENCQRCVQAYEARRRGYDVVAHPTYQGDTMQYNRGYLGGFENPKTIQIKGRTRDATMRNVETEMKNMPNGSRAILRVGWNSTNGHVINVENVGGKVIYRDAQVGVKYNAKDLFSAVKPGTCQLTRVDNLNFTEDIANAVTKDRL